MENYTFDTLPEAVASISKKLDILLEQQSQPEPEVDPLLTLSQLVEYLPEKPAKQTVYGWVNDRKIPFEKHGKRLYFRRSMIDHWLNNGRQV